MLTFRALRLMKFSRRIMIVEVLIVGLASYWIFRDPKALRKYEEAFLTKYVYPHRDPTRPIPSVFRNQYELSLKLCKKFVKRSKPPRIEVRYLGFKKAEHKPVAVEVVKCGRGTALIQAPGHNCFYTLKKGKRNKKYDTKVYNISQKAYYITKYEADEDEEVDENHPTLTRALSLSDDTDSSSSEPPMTAGAPRSYSTATDHLPRPSSQPVRNYGDRAQVTRRPGVTRSDEYLSRSHPRSDFVGNHLAVRSPSNDYSRYVQRVRFPDENPARKQNASRSRVNRESDGDDRVQSYTTYYPTQSKVSRAKKFFKRLFSRSRSSRRDRKRNDRTRVTSDADHAKLFRTASAPKGDPSNQYRASRDHTPRPVNDRANRIVSQDQYRPSRPAARPTHKQIIRSRSAPHSNPHGSRIVFPTFTREDMAVTRPSARGNIPARKRNDDIVRQVYMNESSGDRNMYATPHPAPGPLHYFSEPNTEARPAAVHPGYWSSSERGRFAPRTSYVPDKVHKSQTIPVQRYRYSFEWEPRDRVPPPRFSQQPSNQYDQLGAQGSRVKFAVPYPAPTGYVRNPPTRLDEGYRSAPQQYQQKTKNREAEMGHVRSSRNHPSSVPIVNRSQPPTRVRRTCKKCLSTSGRGTEHDVHNLAGSSSVLEENPKVKIGNPHPYEQRSTRTEKPIIDRTRRRSYSGTLRLPEDHDMKSNRAKLFRSLSADQISLADEDESSTGEHDVEHKRSIYKIPKKLDVEGDKSARYTSARQRTSTARRNQTNSSTKERRNPPYVSPPHPQIIKVGSVPKGNSEPK